MPAPFGSAGGVHRGVDEVRSLRAVLVCQLTFVMTLTLVMAPITSAGGSGHIKVGPNLDISNEPAAQFETSVAVNPSNPSQIVAGSNDRSTALGPGINVTARAYFSLDGGATWGSTPMPKPPLIPSSSSVSEGDTDVAWDTQSHAYFSHLVAFLATSSSPFSFVAAEVGVGRSSDGGRTWTVSYLGLGNGSSVSADVPKIAVDTNPASPFRDTVYVSWSTTFGPPGLLISHSDDFGTTWSIPVSPTGQPPIGGSTDTSIFSDPFVGPDGTVYVAWQDGFLGRVLVAASTDRGQTFGPAATIGSSSQAFVLKIPAANHRGVVVYPACGADTSAGPNRGTLYCAWMNQVPSTATYPVTDIFEAHSTDHGLTWSAPVRVNDDPQAAANDHFSEWLAVDPIDGSVNVIWDDTRNDPTHVSTDVFYARSTDGGVTFSPNVQVTTAPTDLTCCGADTFAQYGEYAGVAAFGGVVHPVWTDMRTSVAAFQQEVFTATLTVTPH